MALIIISSGFFTILYYLPLSKSKQPTELFRA